MWTEKLISRHSGAERTRNTLHECGKGEGGSWTLESLHWLKRTGSRALRANRHSSAPLRPSLFILFVGIQQNGSILHPHDEASAFELLSDHVRLYSPDMENVSDASGCFPGPDASPSLRHVRGSLTPR